MVSEWDRVEAGQDGIGIKSGSRRAQEGIGMESGSNRHRNGVEIETGSDRSQGHKLECQNVNLTQMRTSYCCTKMHITHVMTVK